METPLSEEARDKLEAISAHLILAAEKLKQYTELSNRLLLILQNNLCILAEKTTEVKNDGES